MSSRKPKYVQRYFVFQKMIVIAGRVERIRIEHGMADQPPTLLGRLNLGGHEYQIAKDWAYRAKSGNVLLLSNILIVCYTKPPVVERMFVEEAILQRPGTETVPWTKKGLKAKGKKHYAERQ